MHGTIASLGVQKALQESFAKAQEPEVRIFALLTDQGTAASETMLCEDDLRVVRALQIVFEQVDTSDIDLDAATFEDVTDNDEAACRWCGRSRDDA